MNHRRDIDEFLAKLWLLEERLGAAGFPAMPQWWRDTIERFYRSGKRRLVVRKGRRVFASTCVAPRLSVAEMLWGRHPHLVGMPPHLFAFISVKRDEAEKRLRGVRAILDVLGEKYTEKGETIELAKRPAIFTVVTANFRTSVGETVAFCWCDEVSRWSDDGANPADEVIGSVAPAMATLPDAPLFLVSSPLGIGDYHARQFDLGETATQCVAFGATWQINPTLTEAQCRLEEPDDRRFLREYAAQPQVGSMLAFPYDMVMRAFEPRSTQFAPGKKFLLLDPSSGGASSADWFTWAVGAWCSDEGSRWFKHSDGSYIKGPHARGRFENPDWKPSRPYLHITEINGLQGGFYGTVGGDEIVAKIAKMARRHDISVAHVDQREALFLTSELKRHRITANVHPWTSGSKPLAVELVRRWLAEGLLALSPHERMKAELLGFEERIAPSGAMTFGPRRGGHDDFCALLLTAAHAELDESLPGSPMVPQHTYARFPMNTWLAS